MESQVSNRYRLIEPLGEGGMGVVWRAYDELLDRTVAIKEVRYTGVGDAKRAELNRRTIREARAAGRLDHPSVIVIHDVVEQDGRPWIVMQLVRSRSLAEVLREQGPLAVEQAAAIGGRVLDALRAAHATGVLHRDVKPENVLLADDGRVVLTDFGIASLEAEAGLTATGGLVGTPAYMPPERLNGEPATPESDLWSLGATLYAAVEGEPPFQRGSWAATVAAVLRDEPRRPARAGALEPVIMGLLRRDPAERMPAAEAAALLGRIAAAPPAAGTGHATAWRSTGETSHDTVPRRRGRALWLGLPVAVAAVVLLGAGGLLLVHFSTRTQDPAPTPTAEPTTTTEPTATAEPTRTGEPTRSGEPTETAEPTRSGEPTATARPVPAGWRPFTSAAGRFSIAMPQGWRAAKNPTRDSISFKGPGSSGAMIVEWTVPDIVWKDPVRHWQALEKEILSKGEFEGYDRIGITPTTYLGRDAADWEFTRMRRGVLIHVVNRGFRTADGRPYALYWETPDSRWAADRHFFETFVKTFRPR
ncbi:protein kinase [Nonomuraea phyllanthi]|uniref:serine/threonine-protein kinase n=1 Tax=Nonomuraea phyllanthi TaxID=2219224 RepID=UPI0012931CB3|nr:serine/threonine-protein kinase [Nonomuraea phyllanthi]QFY08387.1 protein kinase [Nonomuraea phyllanthi]